MGTSLSGWVVMLLRVCARSPHKGWVVGKLMYLARATALFRPFVDKVKPVKGNRAGSMGHHRLPATDTFL